MKTRAFLTACQTTLPDAEIVDLAAAYAWLVHTERERARLEKRVVMLLEQREAIREAAR